MLLIEADFQCLALGLKELIAFIGLAGVCQLAVKTFLEDLQCLGADFSPGVFEGLVGGFFRCGCCCGYRLGGFYLNGFFGWGFFDLQGLCRWSRCGFGGRRWCDSGGDGLSRIGHTQRTGVGWRGGQLN